MALATLYENTGPTIGSTEYSLPAGSTTLAPVTTGGVYQIFLDFNAMAAADQFEIKIYEKAYSSGTQRLVYTSTVTGAQPTLWVSPPLVLLNGWDVTVKKLAGTDRAIPYSIRQVS